MLRVMLLLLGADFARRQWIFLLLFGLLWGLLGLVILYEASFGIRLFPIQTLAFLLFFEGVVTLITTISGLNPLKTKLRYAKGLVFIAVALFISEISGRKGDILLALLCGSAFFILGCLQIASAWLVRFSRWRLSLFLGLAQIAISFLFFIPEPIHYDRTAPLAAGIFMLIFSVHALALAWRVHNLPQGRSILELWSHGLRLHSITPSALTAQPQHEATLTVHIWTAAGTAKARPRRLPLINRYIAAVDINGVVSTGHAALEASPNGPYISLYPAQDIDRSPDQIATQLRATPDNNVPGRFLASYETESHAWCESTAKIVFHQFSHPQLIAFWDFYQKNTTYNLTSRNCSSTVAHALEAALEGILGAKKHPFRALLRALLCPELWVAGQLYYQATTMAWTPGLVRDYARALRIVINPPRTKWRHLANRFKRYR